MGAIAERFGVVKPPQQGLGIAARFSAPPSAAANTFTHTDNVASFASPVPPQTFQQPAPQPTRPPPPSQVLQRQVQSRISQQPEHPRVAQLRQSYPNEQAPDQLAQQIDELTQDYPEFASEIESLVKMGRPINVIHATIAAKRSQKQEQEAKKQQAEAMKPVQEQQKAQQQAQKTADQIEKDRRAAQEAHIKLATAKAQAAKDPKEKLRFLEMARNIRVAIASQRANEGPQDVGALGTGVSAASQAVTPMATAMLGAQAGAAGGAFLGPVGAAVGGIGGLLVGGAVGAYGQHKAQQAVMGQQAAADLASQNAANAEQHPVAQFAGDMLPQLAIASPSVANVGKAVSFAGKLVKSTNRIKIVKTAEGAESLANLYNVALGAGIPTARALYIKATGGDLNAWQTLSEIAAGAVLNKMRVVGTPAVKPKPTVIKDLAALPDIRPVSQAVPPTPEQMAARPEVVPPPPAPTQSIAAAPEGAIPAPKDAGAGAATISPIKARNDVQIDLMRRAGIENKTGYALSTTADGELLGKYADEVIAGRMTADDAAAKVKADYEKFVAGEKQPAIVETPNAQPKTQGQGETLLTKTAGVAEAKPPVAAKKSVAKEPTDQATVDEFQDPSRLSMLDTLAQEQRQLVNNDVKTGRQPLMPSERGMLGELVSEDVTGRAPPSVNKGLAIDGWNAQKQGQLETAIANLKAGRKITPAQADRLREIGPYLEHNMKDIPTPENVVSSVKAAPSTAVNEAELTSGTLVRRGDEWYMTKEDTAGKRIVDGEAIKLNDFENVDSKGQFNPGDMGYEKALAEYRAQEAKPSAKPFTLEQQTPDMVAEQKRVEQQLSEINKRQSARLTAKPLETTGDLFGEAENPLFAPPTPKPPAPSGGAGYAKTREGIVARAAELGIEPKGTTEQIAKKVSLKEKALSLLDNVEQQARDEIKTLKSGGAMGMNKPIGLAANYTVIGAAKIARGTIRFAEWSKAMIAEFGETIRPYLRQIYSRSLSVANANHQSPESLNSHVAKLSQSLKVPEAKIPEGMHERQTVTRAAESDTLSHEAAVARTTGEAYAPNTPIKTYAEEGATATRADPVKALETINAEIDPYKRNAMRVGYVMERASQGHNVVEEFNRVAKDLTDAGTLLRIGRELKMGTAEGRGNIHTDNFVKFAAKKNVELSETDRADISAKFTEAERMPDGPEQIVAMQDAVDFAVSKIPKATFWDVLDAYRYSNALSNPRTHGRNIVVNAFNTFVARPAALAGRGQFKDAAKYTVKAAKGTADAITAFVDAWKSHGAIKSMDDIGSTGSESAFAKSYQRQKIPKVLTAIPRFLEAQDKLFSEFIKQGEMARLIESGVDPARAASDAHALAERYLFRDPVGSTIVDKSANEFSRAIDYLSGGLMSARNSESALIKLPARLVAMFVRTPAKVAERGFDFSPLGLASLGPRKEGGKFYQRYYGSANLDGIAVAKFGKTYAAMEKSLAAAKSAGNKASATTIENNMRDVKIARDERIGEAVAGTAVMTVGAMLAASGRTTWSPPQDKEQRDKWYESGRRPYSVQIGNAWVPMYYFGPMFFPLAIPAAARDWMSDNPQRINMTTSEKMKRIAFGMMKVQVGQTSLTGVQNFVDAITTDTGTGSTKQTLDKALAYISSQFVPASGAQRFVSQLVDDEFRAPDGFFEQIAANTPWLSKTVKPKRNAAGEPIKRTLMDSLPPYGIGIDNQQGYEKMMELRKTDESRRRNNQEMENLIADIHDGKSTDNDMRQFVSTLESGERSRIKARLRAKDNKWKQIFPAESGSGSLGGFGSMPGMSTFK